MKNPIYHIVTLFDLQAQTKDHFYKPGNFETDGFIHCTGDKSSSLLVLEDYFAELSKSQEILILEIDPAKLKPEVKFESPAPIEGGGSSHIKDGVLFPHIYGSLNLDAVTGVGTVKRVNNKFVWPSTFSPLNIL